MGFRFELVVIGSGIVGLAVALEAVHRFPGSRVAVLEKELTIARHQTGHNSGVIHSGIYYRPGSLKARNCVAGAAAMVQFCREQGVPYEICGKVVVATKQSELPGLEELFKRGIANGVAGLTMIDRDRLLELEPHCAGIAAVHVPGTGITDYGLVAQKFAELIRSAGGEILTGHEVMGIKQTSHAVLLETSAGAIEAKWAINCAGLQSDRVMRLAGDDNGLKIIPFRGEYYELIPEKRGLVKNLIYPVPDPRFPFLGVHFTRRVGGNVEAGPNAVLALKREGYGKTDISIRDSIEMITSPGFLRMATRYWRNGVGEYYRSLRKRAFTRALQNLIPEIQSSDLRPSGAGVRAQALDTGGSLLDDFSVMQSKRMIHVCNVPSPAATASLLIGKQIMDTASTAFGLETVRG